MANCKYFSTCNGAVVELGNVNYIPEENLDSWIGIKSIPAKAARNCYSSGPSGRKYEYAVGRCSACGENHIAERAIFRKANPSNHKCDARCMGAKGHNCECSCGGKNHGKEAA